MSTPTPYLPDDVVAVYDPTANFDDPPVYEGLASEAHRHLEPGVYQAQAGDNPDHSLLVEADRSGLLVPSPVAPASRVPPPYLVTPEPYLPDREIIVERNPNDPMNLDNQPLMYEGLASQAYRHLPPGVYHAADHSWGETVLHLTVEESDSGVRAAPGPPIHQVAEQAAVIVLAGQYLLNNPQASVDDATQIARAAVEVVQRRTTGEDWRQVVNLVSQHGTGDPNFHRWQSSEASPASPGPPAAPTRERDGVRTTVVGNLSSEPEGGFNEQGHAYARFTVVSSQRRPGPDGGWQDGPKEFTQVVTFRQRAEDALNGLHKGDPVTVTGRPEVEVFTRRDGTPGAAMKIFANTITRREPAADQASTAGITAAAPVRPAGPVVHHNPEHTAVTGVQRTDNDTQQTLKANGFRWSSQRTLWFLPASMPVADRQSRVEQAVATLSQAGITLPVTAEPAQGTTGARAATSAAHQSAAFTPEPFAAAAAPAPART